jgi:hypothetical protein
LKRRHVFVLTGVLLVLILASGNGVWAAPWQDPLRQTVPTASPVAPATDAAPDPEGGDADRVDPMPEPESSLEATPVAAASVTAVAPAGTTVTATEEAPADDGGPAADPVSAVTAAVPEPVSETPTSARGAATPTPAGLSSDDEDPLGTQAPATVVPAASAPESAPIAAEVPPAGRPLAVVLPQVALGFGLVLALLGITLTLRPGGKP